jgi:hypothetical protein
MANTLILPSVIAPQALATLYETTVMLPLVYTDVSSSFGPQKVGNTVNIRRPAVFTANEFDRAVGIVPQNATESAIPVTLNHIADVSFVVTSEDLTLAISDFEQQFLTPAMEAISIKIDNAILSLRGDITQRVGTLAGYEYNIPGSLVDAGRVLDQANVPMTDRVAVIGPVTKAEWLITAQMSQAQMAGSTEALRNANLGNPLYGFMPFMTQGIRFDPTLVTPGSPTTEVDLAFHKTAFAFASAPLEIAPGSNASVMSYKGISIRVAYMYDIKYKQTIVSLDTLYGVKTLDPLRACLMEGALHA